MRTTAAILTLSLLQACAPAAPKLDENGVPVLSPKAAACLEHATIARQIAQLHQNTGLLPHEILRETQQQAWDKPAILAKLEAMVDKATSKPRFETPEARHSAIVEANDTALHECLDD